ncbi:MAG: hypothetical protein AUK37_00535 [Rhodobacterales bacterium CG2_30_65_12]|nr:MAG: hypothetical protein AUK37_00535 [Rhodobacterales bacterium CG2_30_65_12]
MSDLLRLENLRKTCALGGPPWARRELVAVNHVSFSTERGHTMGPVGESGSGKSTLGRCILGLTGADGGRIIFDGADVLGLRGRAFIYVTSPAAGIPDFIAMNASVAPFANPLVRQAIALAVNRSEIRDLADLGAGELGLTEMPTGSIWNDDAGLFGTERNIDAAKALLAAAGFSEGPTVEYLGLPQYPEPLKTGQVLRELLKDIGISMEIKAVDVSVWFDAYVSAGYQITSAYQQRTINPDNFYSLLIRFGGPVNTTFYANPEVESLVDKAAASVDMGERQEMYRQVPSIVTNDAPIIFAHFETLHYPMSSNVAGSTITPKLSLHIENVGFTE